MSLEHVILPNGEHRWFLDGKLLSLNHVSVIVNEGADEHKHVEFWYKDGKLHRDDDGPSEIITYKSAVVQSREEDTTKKSWYRNGKLHRDGDKPALIDNLSGDKNIYYYKDGKLHREGDKPALIEYSLPDYTGSVTLSCAYWYNEGEGVKSIDFFWNEHGYFICDKDVITGKFSNDTIMPLSEDDIKICRTLKYKGKDGNLRNYKVRGAVIGTDFVSRLQEFSFSGDGSDLISIIGRWGCNVTQMLSGLKDFNFTGNMTDIISCINQSSDSHVWQKNSKFIISFDSTRDWGNYSGVKTNGYVCPITGIIVEDTYGPDKIVKRKKDGPLTDKDIRICEEFGLKVCIGN